MTQWDSKQFDAKATDIAQAFEAGRGGLHDLTTKLARDKGLNEEQIRRLGRAVNVKAFEAKFASLKGKTDRIVEFDPVDPESVIKGLFSDSPLAEKRAEARYPDLPNQMRAARGWDTAIGLAKTASVNVYAELKQTLPKDPPLESQLSHWQKVGEELGVKIAGATMRWESAMDELAEHSRRNHWNRDEFEKDAMALHGAEVLPELNALRTDRKLPVLEVTEEQATKLASHLFGEESEDTRLVKRAADARRDYLRAIKARETVKQSHAEVRARILG